MMSSVMALDGALLCLRLTMRAPRQLDGALAGTMSERALPLARTATACEHQTRGTASLGAGSAGCNKRIKQAESLFNSPRNLRKVDVVVRGAALSGGSEQQLKIDGVAVNLDFANDKTLSLGLQAPVSNSQRN